jgi:hypothetical protein
LGFAGGVGKAIGHRVVRAGENLRRTLDGLLITGGLSVNTGVRFVLDMVVEEPRLAEDAGPLGFDDLVALDAQVDVIAHAPAKGAGGVLDDLEFESRLQSGCGGRRCVNRHVVLLEQQVPHGEQSTRKCPLCAKVRRVSIGSLASQKS